MVPGYYNSGIDPIYYFYYTGDKIFERNQEVMFTSIDQGLLLFFIAGGILAIAGILLYISSKK